MSTQKKVVVPAQIQYWMEELNNPNVSINLKDNTAQKLEELMDVLTDQLAKYQKDRKKLQRKYERNSNKWR
tara:strand:- start:4573 stop:4785 length:213 start_codon:yes stop_codon:yes gene_type:complete